MKLELQTRPLWRNFLSPQKCRDSLNAVDLGSSPTSAMSREDDSSLRAGLLGTRHYSSQAGSFWGRQDMAHISCDLADGGELFRRESPLLGFKVQFFGILKNNVLIGELTCSPTSAPESLQETLPAIKVHHHLQRHNMRVQYSGSPNKTR